MPVKGSANPAWRVAVHQLRDVVYRLKPLERPVAGQPVILSYAATPATISTPLPVTHEMHRQGRRHSSSYEKNSSHTRTQLLLGSGLPAADCGRSHRGERISSDSVPQPWPAESGRCWASNWAAPACHWLHLAMLSRAAARRWLAGGSLIADHYNDPIRKASLSQRTNLMFILYPPARHAGSALFPVHSDQFLLWSEYLPESGQQGLRTRAGALRGSRCAPLGRALRGAQQAP